jgi:CDGSH-type Zn-finger protein
MATTREEQLWLCQCGEEQAKLLRRFIDGTYNKEYDYDYDKSKVQIVPSIKDGRMICRAWI